MERGPKLHRYTILATALSTSFANCTDGELRLMDGTVDSEGRVEICINNAWGAVCEAGFTREEATVVCRQLGLLQDEGMCNVLCVDVYIRRTQMRICLQEHINTLLVKENIV